MIALVDRNIIVCVCSSVEKYGDRIQQYSFHCFRSSSLFVLFLPFCFQRACNPHYVLRHDETLDVDFMVEVGTILCFVRLIYSGE